MRIFVLTRKLRCDLMLLSFSEEVMMRLSFFSWLFAGQVLFCVVMAFFYANTRIDLGIVLSCVVIVASGRSLIAASRAIAQGHMAFEFISFSLQFIAAVVLMIVWWFARLDSHELYGMFFGLSLVCAAAGVWQMILFDEDRRYSAFLGIDTLLMIILMVLMI